MSSKRVQQDGCTCGSGNYCHRHKKYATPRSVEHCYDDREIEHDVQRLTRDEQCGGGRRVLRGGFSGNNRQW